MTRLLIIGGSDAGISAGLRAREIDPGVTPLLIVADRYPNYSICGIPYHISGDVPDWRNLAHRTRADLENAGLRLMLDTRATRIDSSARQVTVVSADGGQQSLDYDSLIIGTGAEPVRPPIAGLDRLRPADGVHVLHTIGDTRALATTLNRAPRSALIVGAGYIGLEMAEALRARGLRVTVVEQQQQVLPTVDEDLARLVTDELNRHDVDVHTGVAITAIDRTYERQLRVTGKPTADADDPSFTTTVDLVLVVVGVRPDTTLAQTAHVDLGVRGAIAVDRQMRTSVDGIWAAGDCVHTYHRVLDTDAYLPLGSTAHKQGTVAGENALGGQRSFAGSVGTQVVKVFDLVAARTGMREAEATHAGFTPASHRVVADDHKAYYPGARPITITVTGDATTGHLLGAQLIGHPDTAVAKRVDVYATALHHRMTVDQISHSAANTLLSLAELAAAEPGTEVTWAIRSASPARTYGGGDADALPARGALGSRLREHVDAGRIRLLTGFSVHALTPTKERVAVVVRHADGNEESIVVDRIVAATGFRPDHSIAAELRLDLDPVMGATRALAPLIDPNEHSCGTVPPHGVDELAHPEAGYYAVGMKSYGRAPTFLMATGYEQVRSVVAALAGDWQAARDVQLDLPETGVCNSNPADSTGTDSCCGPAPAAQAAGKGLATGISGGLLSAPLNLITLDAAPAGGQTGGCCGS